MEVPFEIVPHPGIDSGGERLESLLRYRGADLVYASSTAFLDSTADELTMILEDLGYSSNSPAPDEIAREGARVLLRSYEAGTGGMKVRLVSRDPKVFAVSGLD